MSVLGRQSPAEPDHTSAAPSGAVATRAQIWFVHACMFIFGIVLLLMGSLLPEMRVSAAHAGSLGSLPLAGILAATVFVGPVFDKAGPKPLLMLSLALIAGAMAILPSLSSWPALAVAALAYGFGGGILNTVTNALISVLRASSRASALNLLGFSFSLGAIAAPLLFSAAQGALSPAILLRILAAAPAAILLLMLPLKFPRGLRAGEPLSVLLAALRHPALWIFGILLFFESGNENCVFVWAARLVADTLRPSGHLADLALVAVSVGIGAGRLLAALASRWVAQRTLLLASCAIILGGSVAVASAIHWQGFIAAVAGFAVLGLGMASVFPTTLAIAGERFPGETGTAFGAIMTIALLGGTAGPLAGGWLSAWRPAGALWAPVGAAAGMILIVIAALRPAAATLEKPR
jgi:MFS transporter, FHS family, glucose/mannose:H+ symporter